MNIALPHYRAPCVTPTECWAELRPQCPSIQVEPSPHSEGAVHIQADTPHRPAFTPHNCQTDSEKISMPQAIIISSVTRKWNNIFWHLKPLSLFFLCFWTLMSKFKTLGWFSLMHTSMATVVVLQYILSLLTQSFTKIRRIRDNQLSLALLTQCISLTLGPFLIKLNRNTTGTTQGPDLDFTRWWVVAPTSLPDLFFLLASFSSLFQHGISQSPLPTDTWSHSSAANTVPL